MHKTSLFLTPLLLVLPSFLPAAPGDTPAPAKTEAPAKKAAPKPVDPTKAADRLSIASWKARHEKFVAELSDAKNLEPGIVFVGDSITQGWESKGKAEWTKNYAPYKSLNRGISGDETQHVLWRLENGETTGLNPKLFVVMIGTNNVGHGTASPEKTAEGVKAIVDKLLALHPKSKVLLLSVFPRAEKPADKARENVVQLNKALSKMGDGSKVTYLDIFDKFLAADGTLSKDIMPDLLHPNAKGYAIWADAIRSKVEEVVGPPPALPPEAPAGEGLYTMAVNSLDGKPRNLSEYQGKVTLVVNVASHCGFTKQYEGLQKLSVAYAGKPFSILAFPSNDFGGQEPGSAEEIQTFCTSKFGVTFPMFEKVKTKGEGQSPVYTYLNAADGGPKWNFHKYLVGKDGKVIAGFPSKVTPESDELKAAIDKALAQ